MKLVRSILFIFLTSPLLLGCDKQCKYTVNDQATVRNHTGSALSLAVCKGLGQRRQVEVSNSGASFLQLGTSENADIQDGPSSLASCPAHAGETRETKFALTTESFNVVKLCLSDSTDGYDIVNVNDSCPLGTRAQTSPSNCEIGLQTQTSVY